MKFSKNAFIKTRDERELAFKDGQMMGIIIGGLISAIVWLILI
jgi:hypothetical protein